MGFSRGFCVKPSICPGLNAEPSKGTRTRAQLGCTRVSTDWQRTSGALQLLLLTTVYTLVVLWATSCVWSYVMKMRCKNFNAPYICWKWATWTFPAFYNLMHWLTLSIAITHITQLQCEQCRHSKSPLMEGLNRNFLAVTTFLLEEQMNSSKHIIKINNPHIGTRSNFIYQMPFWRSWLYLKQ